jgi:acyl-CoA synthetase (AMP-forming)/AMP-acid ligase II
MNIAAWLHRTALSTPNAPALLTGARLHANYRQFAERAYALAQCLQNEYSLQPGDRVALYMKNRVEYLELMYATWWLGGVIVPINHKLHAREAAWIIDNAEARVLCSDAGQLCEHFGLANPCRDLGVDSPLYQQAAGAIASENNQAQAIREESARALLPPLPVDPHAIAWLFYTSGTTGRPKGVMLTHRNLIAMSLCYTLDVDEVYPQDAALYAAPMSHGAGLYNFIHVRRGARHVVPPSRGFDPQEIFDLGEIAGPLSFFAAPTMIKRIVDYTGQSGRDGAGIRTIVYGGGPMYRADIEHALQQMGPKFAQIYGQGESPMTITALRREIIADNAHPAWPERLGSVGQAQSCMEVRIVDERLRDLPANIPGEVLVRGDAVMQGYWRNDVATRETLINGWLRTGDIGYLSRDGFLTLTDRLKDVIISGGSNIYPREVEEVLASHPAVAEVAVIGVPSSEWGEDVLAFVVPATGHACTAQVLDDWCRQHMAAFKRPKRYEFRPELPKNNYGKIPKTDLRALLD